MAGEPCCQRIMQERLKSISLSISKDLEKQGFAIVPGVLQLEAVEVLATKIENGLGRQARDTGYAMRHLVQMVPATVHVIAKIDPVG